MSYTLFTCLDCHRWLGVPADERQKSLLLRKVNKCPTIMCRGDLEYREFLDGKRRVQVVSFESFFRSVSLGLPINAKAPKEECEELFLGDEISSVELRELGSPPRTIVKKITFRTGNVMHFDASAEGACVIHLEAPNV